MSKDLMLVLPGLVASLWDALLPSTPHPNVYLVHSTSSGNRGIGSEVVRKIRGHRRLVSQEGGH